MKNQKSSIKYRLKNSRGDKNNIHFACLKTKKGKILALAQNDEFKHAEVRVIEKAKKIWTRRQLQNFCRREGGLVIEVVRISKNNDGVLLSKPCVNCQRRIENCHGIVAVYHS